jgi:cytochrome c-type protein NapC
MTDTINAGNARPTPSSAPVKPQPGLIRRALRWFFTPARTIAWGVIASVAFVLGIGFWGAFNWGMEATNNTAFCISCHEMQNNVFKEYRNTVHASNRSGVQAGCQDCHVPKEWGHKMVRKVQASYEVWGKITGKIDTPEKFDAHRLDMAKSVWRAMKTTDSRECRNCHKFDAMDYAAQEPRSSNVHQAALTAGKTCIDCHQGIAHRLPPNAQHAYQDMLDNVDKVSPLQSLIDFLQGADVARVKKEVEGSRSQASR